MRKEKSILKVVCLCMKKCRFSLFGSKYKWILINVMIVVITQLQSQIS